MHATAKFPKLSVLAPNPSRLERFQRFIEQAASHLSLQPHHVASVRQGKTLPIHERQCAENLKLVSQGYDKNVIVAALELMIVEVEDATEPHKAGAPYLSLVETYQSLLEAEGHAAPLQNRASVTGDAGDLDVAIEASALEIAREKEHLRAMIRRRDTLRSLNTHVGFRGHAS